MCNLKLRFQVHLSTTYYLSRQFLNSYMWLIIYIYRWKLLDFAELKRSSISFFDIDRTETALSRWSRARKRAAKVGSRFPNSPYDLYFLKCYCWFFSLITWFFLIWQVGKGLSKDEKARKLALQHWLEAVSTKVIKIIKEYF